MLLINIIKYDIFYIIYINQIHYTYFISSRNEFRNTLSDNQNESND